MSSSNLSVTDAYQNMVKKRNFSSWKATPNPSNFSSCNILNPSTNIPNINAAPYGSAAGMVLNKIPDNYSHYNPLINCSDQKTISCKNKFNPNPIRHYRKSYSNPRGKLPINTFDIPGGTIFRSKECSNQDYQCGLGITSSYKTKVNLDTVCSTSCAPCNTAKNALARVRNGSTKGTKYCSVGVK